MNVQDELAEKVDYIVVTNQYHDNYQKKNSLSLENQDSQMVYLENQVQQLEMNRVDKYFNNNYQQKLQEQMIQAKNDEISLKQLMNVNKMLILVDEGMRQDYSI